MKPVDWIKAAEMDLKAARSLMKEDLTASVAFHAQQAAEKAVKARVLQLRVRVPKVHDLLKLAREADIKDAKLVSKLQFLDRFYQPTRYPDAMAGSLEHGLPSVEEAEKALKSAELVVGWIKRNLSQGGGGG